MKGLRVGTVCAGVILWACGPEADGRAAAEIDLTPPVLLAAACSGPGSAEMRFSEPVTLVAGSFASDPPLELSAARPEGDRLLLDTGAQTPGGLYLVELTVADARGNTAALVVPLYGFNPDVPALLINELTVRGSSTHPDIVELRLASAGDMGGLVLYNGTAGSWTDRIVFPAFRVEAGDFVLAHFKPEGVPEEVDDRLRLLGAGRRRAQRQQRRDLRLPSDRRRRARRDPLQQPYLGVRYGVRRVRDGRNHGASGRDRGDRRLVGRGRRRQARGRRQPGAVHEHAIHLPQARD
jgi:hypothetical protein